MIEWGISGNSHDAAIAVFKDSQLVFAGQSERFSGKKNDKDLCQDLVDYARNHHGGLPDQVVWYENPYTKTARQLSAGQGFKWSENNIKQYLSRWGICAPVKFVRHHHSHAAAGYYTSPFDDACVVVIDAIGEFNTLTIWQGSGDDLTQLYSLDFPHSIGLWYSAMTQRCHLKPLEDEYILMGMAAYGDASRLTRDMLEDFVSFRIDDNSNPLTFKKNLHRGCMDWRPDLTVSDTFDIAAATQQVYEILLERVLQHAIHLSSSRNLVLMGGCALNCSANRLTGKYFDSTWIMPNPGDAGSAVGAVLAYNGLRVDNQQFTPYLGYDMGSETSNEEIVDYLIDNNLCGVARHRAEFGPRALGNRSLLADPRGIDIKDRVNEIKQRQQFRPFAPAILAEHVHEYFDMPAGWRNGSAYMQVVARCRRPDAFPAIVHVDSTSRVQTVANDGSPFRLLLEEWYRATGCPMLLNTSLNIRGEPMVNDRDGANRFEQQYGVRVFT